jgi:hypothetical protein
VEAGSSAYNFFVFQIMSATGHSFTAHIRRLSTAGTVLYIRIANSDMSRLGLRHGQDIEIDLGRVRITGTIKTSGGSPWLAPSPGSSNAAITSALRGVSFAQGMDVPATLRCLGASPTWSGSANFVSQSSSAVRPSGVRSPSVSAPSARVRVVQGQDLWDRITRHLTTFLPTWRTRIAEFGQVAAVERRLKGERWSDNEIFEGIVLGLLSNSVDWAKIQAVRPYLSGVFLGFSPAEYRKLDDASVGRLIAWFSNHGATLPYNGKFLNALGQTAAQLCAYSQEHGSMEQFLDDLFRANGADAKRLAVALGGAGRDYKLSGLGVPLVAESLKNIGYDLAKPDRHINRAAVCFGLVEFSRWPDRSARNTPTLGQAELLTVMEAMQKFSRDVGQLATFVDNAVWLLCAKSGLWMSNADLIALAAE